MNKLNKNKCSMLYAIRSDLNNDQRIEINNHNWVLYTECVEGNKTYYLRGYHIVNRSQYVILSDPFNYSSDAFEFYSLTEEEFNKLAKYDDTFNNEVAKVLNPIADIDYFFLVKDPKQYRLLRISTNMGLNEAKVKADHIYAYKHEYIDDSKIKSALRRVQIHNKKVEKETAEAIELLKNNGFTIMTRDFIAVKSRKRKK